MIEIPEGFTPWSGGECPVAPGTQMVLLIRTAQGPVETGVMAAKLHVWEHGQDADGFGDVLAYRELT